MPRLQLLPAIDIVNGQAVMLYKGEAGTESVYGHPLQAARRWVEAGAEWIHVVDLDAAFGRGSNHELIAELVAGADVQVEIAGGIRDDDSLARALATGTSRVILGTAAIENPDWTARVIAEHGERIAVGLDVRGTTLASRGWTEDAGNLWDVLARLDAAGCARYAVTDVNRDGTLSGPNIDLLTEMTERTNAPVIASGGISTLSDIEALAGLTGTGVEGAIIGKALYEGNFTLEQALDITGRA